MLSEITIRYIDANTLKVLKSLAKYMHFTISKPVGKKDPDFVYANIVPMIPGDSSVDIADMGKIVSRNNMDASTLRKQAWQRNK
jgi:hypothetical protein